MAAPALVSKVREMIIEVSFFDLRPYMTMFIDACPSSISFEVAGRFSQRLISILR